MTNWLVKGQSFFWVSNETTQRFYENLLEKIMNSLKRGKKTKKHFKSSLSSVCNRPQLVLKRFNKMVLTLSPNLIFNYTTSLSMTFKFNFDTNANPHLFYRDEIVLNITVF